MVTENEEGTLHLLRSPTRHDLEKQPPLPSNKANFDLLHVIRGPGQGLQVLAHPLLGDKGTLLPQCPRALGLHLLGGKGIRPQTPEICQTQLRRRIQV